MLDDLMLARRVLAEGDANLVIARGGEIVFIGWSKGLMDLAKIALTNPGLLRGSSVADKVVGRAAAVICSVNGAKSIYAQVMSKYALEELRKGGVEIHYEKLVPHIEAPGGGPCPFESLIMDLSDLHEAYERLMKRFRELGWG